MINQRHIEIEPAFKQTNLFVLFSSLFTIEIEPQSNVPTISTNRILSFQFTNLKKNKIKFIFIS